MPGFFEAGGRAVKFDQPGATITGKVVTWREQQSRVYGTDEPATWQDGSPKMEAVIVLEVDPEDDQDTGTRSLYVASTRQKRALIDALRRGGSKTPDEGGTLTMTYTGDDANSKNPRQPAKLYTASWSKPEQASVTLGTGQPAAQPQQARQQPVHSPQADPWAPAGLTQEQARKLQQLDAIPGLDDATVAGALGVTVEVLRAARQGDEII